MSANKSLVMIKPRVGYFPGSVNIGLVLAETGAILIDTGLDTQTAKKIKKGLDEINQPLQAIIQTHAHADHFGGNAFLLSSFPDSVVYAPPLEEAVIRYPILEPIYLGLGAAPVPDLQNKFLLAEPSRVDQLLPPEGEVTIEGVSFTILPLPGHSWQQVGVVCDNICFAADSYLGEETLAKHKLPFLIDAHQTLLSLDELLKTNYEGYLPGHGTFTNAVEPILLKNRDSLRTILSTIEMMLEEKPLTLEETLTNLCGQLGLSLENLTGYVLNRTALMGYLVGLLREDRIGYKFEANRMLWYKM